MQINKAALEIFDFTSSLAVYSEHELKVGDQAIQDYIANHVVKAFKDPGARTGTLHDASPVGKQLLDYKNGELKFIDLCKNLGESLFSYMKQATDSVVIDTIICEAVTDTPYVCILLCQAHDAFTHQLFSEDDGTLATELVSHKAVLPMPSQKLRAFASINLHDFSVRIFEPKGEFDGEVSYILADKVLQLGTNQSSRDTVRKVKTIVEALKALGKVYEKEGALWLKSTDYGDDKDRVVIRDNGVPTYLAADIAYHRNKFDRGFKEMIDIWGADHHGYVCRVKAAMAAFGYDPDKLTVLLLQMVALFRDGQLVKLSKRSGDSVTLDELIDEVGVDASRYFFLMRSLDSQLDFDINLAKSRSNDNPVYYIQYAHARIHSIYNQVREAGIAFGDYNETDFTTLTSEMELELIKKLAEYPEEVVQAAEHRAPHRIARYLYDLASMFHSFYRQGRIIGVDPALQQARLGLITAIALVLRQGLGILGISAPEKM